MSPYLEAQRRHMQAEIHKVSRRKLVNGRGRPESRRCCVCEGMEAGNAHGGIEKQGHIRMQPWGQDEQTRAGDKTQGKDPRAPSGLLRSLS